MMIDLSSLSIQLCIAKHSKGVKPELLSVPSEGPHALAGESPARVRAGSPVAWIAGGDGNVAY